MNNGQFRTPPDVTILPEQASRLAAVGLQTGAAIGVSQSGSTLTIDTGDEIFRINAQGTTIEPQEETLC